ncbi:hypothetical protein KKC1_08490 [Calderihabitans maritimus]|uniref:Uncharacterized protein n=1 Tax=Calderihabitans maritimus TaxID=1246530 RepID=A0A1Z5HQH3_9FIRM|nr:hypothetical protein KKC1_08490 [Calderihabitans maritimus]
MEHRFSAVFFLGTLLVLVMIDNYLIVNLML